MNREELVVKLHEHFHGKSHWASKVEWDEERGRKVTNHYEVPWTLEECLKGSFHVVEDFHDEEGRPDRCIRSLTYSEVGEALLEVLGEGKG